MKLPSRLLIAAVAVFCFAFLSVAAKADHVFNLNETLQSGATFSGTVTFADDYMSITGVNGVLTGYDMNTTGYVGGNSTDTFDRLYCNTNCSYYPTGNTYGDWFLDDGTQLGNYSNFLKLTYDYTNAPNLTFAGIGTISSGYPDNGAGYNTYMDPMVSGTLTPAAATPEPSTISMLLLATGTLGQFAAKRRMRRS